MPVFVLIHHIHIPLVSQNENLIDKMCIICHYDNIPLEARTHTEENWKERANKDSRIRTWIISKRYPTGNDQETECSDLSEDC